MAAGVISFLVAILVACAAAWGAWMLTRRNPNFVAGTLTELGAQIPTPGDDPGHLGDPDAGNLPPPPVVGRPAPIVQSGPPTTSGFVLQAADGDRLALDPGRHEVGREIGLALSLPGETTVSRRHAAILVMTTGATVEDLGSTNGTFVGGVRVTGSVPLRSGDVVRFGTAEYRVL